jgi:gliding motility-associated-like protein
LSRKLLYFLLVGILLSSFAHGQVSVPNFPAPAVTSGCSPLVVGFVGSATNPPYTLTWNFGGGPPAVSPATSTNPSQAVLYNFPGTYFVTLTATNNISHISQTTAPFKITVLASPIANFGASDTTGCYPLHINFIDSSAAGLNATIISWIWDFGDGSPFDNTENPSHVYTLGGNFPVTLQIQNNLGCHGSASLKTKSGYITIAGGIVANFVDSPSNSCKPPTAVYFNNLTSGPGSITYKWNFGDGGTSVQTNPVHNYASGGNETALLIATSNLGCIDSSKHTFTINSGTVSSNFTAPASVCVGVPVQFQNTSNPTPNSSIWNFGDGSPLINQPSPSYTYSKTGNYNITLNNSFATCNDSITKSITVVNPAVAAFSSSNPTSCKSPFAVNFKDQSSNATSWSWDFGDGNTSNLQNPSHTYTSYGNFNVSLTASNANNCGSVVTQTGYVKIVNPSVKIADLPLYGCNTAVLNPSFTDTAVDGIASYAWNFDNGQTSTVANPPTQIYLPGKYSVSLTITTNGGCTATDVDSVKVGTTQPIPAFSASPTTVCRSSAVQFTDHSVNGNQWYWQFGDGGTSKLQNPSHVYNKSGPFTVELTVYDNGCDDTLTKVNYIIVNPPYSNFSDSFSCNKLGVAFVDSSIGATSWLWNFGDGTTSASPNPPPHTYLNPGPFQVSLIVNNSSTGCADTSSRTVAFSPNVSLALTNGPLCKNIPAQFSTINYGNVNTYFYDFGDGTTEGPKAGDGSPQHIYTQAGNFIATLYAVENNGCKDTVFTAAKVSGPTALYTTIDTLFCGANTAHFTDQSTPSNGVNIVKWFWDFGDGATSTQPNPSHLYSIQGIYPVKLTVTDASGCMDSLIKPNLVVVSVITASFTVSTDSSCPSAPINFSNTSTPGFNPTFLWNFGNGNTYAGSNPPTQTYAGVGLYGISLTMKDSYGCTTFDTLPKILTIGIPVASFTEDSVYASCPPLKEHFTFTGSYANAYQWSFGNAEEGFSADQNPFHIYGIPGTDTVRLIITSPGGCTATADTVVTIKGSYGIPQYSPLDACDTLTVNFTVVANGAVQYTWFPGDLDANGKTDSIITLIPSLSHFYGQAGTYIPILRLEDSSGCEVGVAGVQKIIIDSVKAQFSMDKNVVCLGSAIQFRNTSYIDSGTVITLYSWDFGDGTPINSSPNDSIPTHTYATQNIYTVKLIVYTQFGCLDSVVHQIKVVNNPVADITGAISQCLPANLNFAGVILVPDTATVSWSWNLFNGQPSSVQDTVSQFYGLPGNDSVRLVVTNGSGCPDTVTKYFTIFPLPTVQASTLGFTPDTTICLGKSIPLIATGALSYVWAPPSNSSLSCSNCTSPTATPLVTTTYSVTGTSVNGCMASDTMIVAVNGPRTVSVLPASDSVCIGQTVQLNATGEDLFAWSPAASLSNSAISNPRAFPTTTTIYQVIGSDNEYCFSDTQYVNVTVFNYPKLNLGPDVTIAIGSSYQIPATGSADIVSVNWLPVTGLSCANCLAPLATPQNTTTYVATAVNNGTCALSDSVKITVVCTDNNFFVPNTFSPNGDGVNDVFYVRGKGLNIIPSMVIFNRWGQIVFEKRDFAPNDPAAGWDGMFDGKKAPVDVYIYTIQIICDNSTLISYHGNVALIR